MPEPEWEYSASGPMRMEGDADCVCAVCGAVEGRPHQFGCPIGQASAALARMTAERNSARERLTKFRVTCPGCQGSAVEREYQVGPDEFEREPYRASAGGES